jgi:hypothetical protein
MCHLLDFWKMSIWPNIVIHHARGALKLNIHYITYFNFFFNSGPKFYIYVSSVYGYRQGRIQAEAWRACAPPKYPFLMPKSVTCLPLTSYPGFASDRYKLFVVFSIFTLYQVFFITVVGILND